MLRITVKSDPGTLTFQLEGRLAGPWVQELEECWQRNLGGQPPPSVRFDLRGVTFIDAAGRAFLAARHAQGAEMVTTCCLMRGVVAEIAKGSPECTLERLNERQPDDRS